MDEDKPVIIRRAGLHDVESITDIYNEAILHTTATFDTETKAVAERTIWFQSHNERHPILVAAVEDRVVGWASLSAWSDRCAYDETAEASFYVKSDFRGHGIGRKLLEAVIDEARRVGLYTVIGRVAEGSAASLHLCESIGFSHVGTLKEVGRKFGKRLDVDILQMILR